MASSFGAQFKRRRTINASPLNRSNMLSILSKDTTFCRGMYNQQERDLQIKEYEKLSRGLRMKVSSIPLSHGEAGEKSRCVLYL